MTLAPVDVRKAEVEISQRAAQGNGTYIDPLFSRRFTRTFDCTDVTFQQIQGAGDDWGSPD